MRRKADLMDWPSRALLKKLDELAPTGVWSPADVEANWKGGLLGERLLVGCLFVRLLVKCSCVCLFVCEVQLRAFVCEVHFCLFVCEVRFCLFVCLLVCL